MYKLYITTKDALSKYEFIYMMIPSLYFFVPLYLRLQSILCIGPSWRPTDRHLYRKEP